MSITNELRLFAADPYTSWVPTDKQQTDLRAIADRIDAEHEKSIQQALMGEGGVPATDENMAEHGWVRLPVDADGVPIHVGDVMEYADKPTEPLTVSYIELEEKGWWVFAGGMGRRPDKYRHHHAPTVEDVLREFALAVCRDEALTIRKGVVEEFAAKLRLAEKDA